MKTEIMTSGIHECVRKLRKEKYFLRTIFNDRITNYFQTTKKQTNKHKNIMCDKKTRRDIIVAAIFVLSIRVIGRFIFSPYYLILLRKKGLLELLYVSNHDHMKNI